MDGDHHGYSYATSLAAITDEIQIILKIYKNKNSVYMGERVSGRPPSSVPTVDKRRVFVGSIGSDCNPIRTVIFSCLTNDAFLLGQSDRIVIPFGP